MNPNSQKFPAVAGLAAAFLLLLCVVAFGGGPSARKVKLPPSNTVAGYVAMLLVNETPFPGERGWVSEEDSKGAMRAILGVCDSRLNHVPTGYRQEHIAAERCDDIIDVITAGGEKGQCDGFYRNKSGKPVAVARVHQRIEYLVMCANKGEPGKFARLLQYAGELALEYEAGTIKGDDLFAQLDTISGVPVTGRAYSWMTDVNNYNPGGSFVRIPDSRNGAMGGNRFFTLRKKE